MARLRMVAGLFGTLIAIAVALAVLDSTTLARAFAQLSFGVLAAAAGLSLMTTLLLSVRWAILAAPAGKRLGGREFRDALVSHVFNLITPASAGADAYRVMIAGDREGGRGRAASLVILERLIGIGCYALVFLLCYALAGRAGRAAAVFSASAPVFALVAAVPIVTLLLTRLVASHRHRWIEARIPVTLKAMLEGLAGVRPTRAAMASGVSTLGTMAWLACVDVLANATGTGLERTVVAMIAIVTEFSRLLPISVQGVGVREATFAFLAAQAGGSSEAAFAACATAYALHFALVAVIALAARHGFGFLPRLIGGMKQVTDQFLRGVR
jgi:uncharacterized membrane protein YbhN (UPF0104 family)